MIRKSIATLGFKIQDVKYLLNSHAHFDHSGGLAELKRQSGAELVISRGDRDAIASGRPPSGGAGSSWPPAVVDRVIDDGSSVQLGGVTLIAHVTPGHTRGCTTWTLSTAEQGKRYRVVFYCSTTVPGYQLVNNRDYPQIVSDYERSFEKLKVLPCEVFLAPHGSFFKLEDKHARVGRQEGNPLVDPTELKAYVTASEAAFRSELKRQQQAVSQRN